MFYAEDATQFFVPIEVIFLHPMGYIGGADYDSYSYALEYSKNIYSIKLKSSDPYSLSNDLTKAINDKLEKFSIKNYNVIYYISHNPEEDETIINILYETNEFCCNKNNQEKVAIYNAVFHKEDNKDIITNVLICET